MTTSPISAVAGSYDEPGEQASGEAAPRPAAVLGFDDYAIHPDIVAAIAEQGIVTPFPIQAMTLPVALSGHDIIGQAKTGTGKTLGFGIPLLHHVMAPTDPGFGELPHGGYPQALVIVPTRELCTQVTRDLQRAGTRRGIRVQSIYGGRAFEPQIQALTRGVEVVVGTPGRLIDLAQQRVLQLAHVRTLVLDEADEMLDLGFLPDVEKLVAQTPASRQTMLFSATMPGAVVYLARRYMQRPTHIRALADGDEGKTVAAIEQVVYRAHAMDKVELLTRVLQARDRGLTIVFSRTKRTAAKVADELVGRGFAAASIHGDLGQGAREQALRAFRNGKIDILVATDVAARGIDVENVTHVINYQCPEDEKTYLHRTGRTGRAGQAGVAITLVDWDDMPRWGLINKALDLGIPDPRETYSSSEHLFTELGIEPSVTGRLPRSARTRAGLEAEDVEELGETGRSSRGARVNGASARRRTTGTQSRHSPGHGEVPTRQDPLDPRRRVRNRRRTKGTRRDEGPASSSPMTTSGDD